MPDRTIEQSGKALVDEVLAAGYKMSSKAEAFDTELAARVDRQFFVLGPTLTDSRMITGKAYNEWRTTFMIAFRPKSVGERDRGRFEVPTEVERLQARWRANATINSDAWELSVADPQFNDEVEVWELELAVDLITTKSL